MIKTTATAALTALVAAFAAVLLGTAPAQAACTTFDEHNKVVMRDCPSGGAGSATVPDGAAAHRGETPEHKPLPKKAEPEPEEPAEPAEPAEPTE